MTRRRIGVLTGAAVLAAAGLGAGTTIAVSSSSGPQPAAATAPGSPPYSYYRSMMGGYRQMTGTAGYQWMFGGAAAPAWMRGAALPGAVAGMMGSGTGPGQFMGRLWADAPGSRVSAAQAAGLGRQVPAGARVDAAARTITFRTASVHLVAVASPAGGPDETFRIAGLTDPAITVPAGAQVSIQVVNADPDSAHGLVITAAQGLSSPVPMMTSRPAFAGAALWFLGDPTSAGMHTATMTFTAATPGSYRYLCPVPGHAQQGMNGTFTVGRVR